MIDHIISTLQDAGLKLGAAKKDRFMNYNLPSEPGGIHLYYYSANQASHGMTYYLTRSIENYVSDETYKCVTHKGVPIILYKDDGTPYRFTLQILIDSLTDAGEADEIQKTIDKFLEELISTYKKSEEKYNEVGLEDILSDLERKYHERVGQYKDAIRDEEAAGERASRRLEELAKEVENIEENKGDIIEKLSLMANTLEELPIDAAYIKVIPDSGKSFFLNSSDSGRSPESCFRVIKSNLNDIKGRHTRVVNRAKRVTEEYRIVIEKHETQFTSFKKLKSAEDPLEALRSIPGYVDFLTIKDGDYNVLMGITEPIHIDYQNKRYHMGQYKVKYYPRTGGIYVKQHADNQVIPFDGRNFIHCHIFARGGVCVGSYGRGLTDASKSGDMFTLFMLMRMHLGSYNPNSPTCALDKFKGEDIPEEELEAESAPNIVE